MDLLVLLVAVGVEVGLLVVEVKVVAVGALVAMGVVVEGAVGGGG